MLNAIEIIKKSRDRGADLVIFPEKFLTEYVPELIVSNVEKFTIAENDKRLFPHYEQF